MELFLNYCFQFIFLSFLSTFLNYCPFHFLKDRQWREKEGNKCVVTIPKWTPSFISLYLERSWWPRRSFVKIRKDSLSQDCMKITESKATFTGSLLLFFFFYLKYKDIAVSTVVNQLASCKRHVIKYSNN